MKRIAIISKTYGNGGVEKALVNLLKHIDYNQYQVDLIVPNSVREDSYSVTLKTHIFPQGKMMNKNSMCKFGIPYYSNMR